MYDVILEISQAIVKNGLNLSALGTVLFILLKRRRVKKVISRYFPWLAMEPEDVANYEARQIRIEQDVRAIKEHLGVTGWNAAEISYTANSGKPMLISSHLERLNALFAKRHITRRNKTMKEYLKKLGRTKFQALLLSLAINAVSAVLFLNGTLDIDSVINQWMPIINMTILTISTWVYIIVEGGIDKANAQGTEVSNASYTSSKDAGDV